MGKKSTPTAPTPPSATEVIDAQADVNRYDTYSPFGNTTWSKNNDTGRWRQDNTFSPEAQRLFDRTLALTERNFGRGGYQSNNYPDSPPPRPPQRPPSVQQQGQIDAQGSPSPGVDQGFNIDRPVQGDLQQSPQGRQLTLPPVGGGVDQGFNIGGNLTASGVNQEEGKGLLQLPGGVDPVFDFNPPTNRTIDEDGNTQVSFNAPVTPGSPQGGYDSFYDDYGRTMNDRSSYLIERGFNPQIKAFQEEMANRGVVEGSELYNEQYRTRLGDPMAQAYDSSSYRAIAAGEALKLQDYNMLSSIWGRNQVAPTMPIDAVSPYNSQYQGQYAGYASQVARQNAQAGAVGSTIGSVVGGIYGGPAGSAAGGYVGGGSYKNGGSGSGGSV